MGKKEKLTKEEALQHCYDLWSWLAENPSKEKWHWPNWDYNEGNLRASHDCFACEFRKQHKLGCTACIIPCFASPGHCGEDNSPYAHWTVYESLESRIRSAEIIRDSAKEALAALREAEKNEKKNGFPHKETEALREICDLADFALITHGELEEWASLIFTDLEQYIEKRRKI